MFWYSVGANSVPVGYADVPQSVSSAPVSLAGSSPDKSVAILSVYLPAPKRSNRYRPHFPKGASPDQPGTPKSRRQRRSLRGRRQSSAAKGLRFVAIPPRRHLFLKTAGVFARSDSYIVKLWGHSGRQAHPRQVAIVLGSGAERGGGTRGGILRYPPATIARRKLADRWERRRFPASPIQRWVARDPGVRGFLQAIPSWRKWTPLSVIANARKGGTLGEDVFDFLSP